MVAVGGIFISSDGKTWETAKGTQDMTVHYEEIVYGMDMYAAVYRRGGILSSSDGKLWNFQKSPIGSGTGFSALTFCNCLFIASTDPVIFFV